MEQNKNISTRLFFTSFVENKDDFEEKLEHCHNVLQNITANLSEKEAHDSLNNAVCKDKTHEEISLGLLIEILTEPQAASNSYRDLTLLTRDGLAVVIASLNQIVLEKYIKLTDVAKNQLMWLLREMIKTNVNNVDNLCLSLLRHAAGGDISSRNIFLVENLLEIFHDNRSWLDKFPYLIASIVYTYLRLIEDHSATHLSNLRQKEVTFLVCLIREKITDCLVIGRDFIRLLQNVARIPEIEILWKEILLNPKSLNPNFNGVLQFLQTRTSRRFLQSRLTPDMERKLVFLTSQVRFGNHKRYQEWFQRQYLATPESQTLRCDLIRFIVGVIHPTNELLCSDIIPRWAVIGWLFTTCTMPVAASNAKLALFYDWLFFEPEKDNIMNIEPAILVMHNSMRSHPAVTATLLDFLCRIISNFYPPIEEKVKHGIFLSLRNILEKRVLPSLHPLFDSPKLDRELRVKIRDTFKEFCVSFDTEDANKEFTIDTTTYGSTLLSSDENHIVEQESTFSDEEEEITGSITVRVENIEIISPDKILAKNTHKCNIYDKNSFISSTIPTEFQQLKNLIESLYYESDNEVRCQTTEKVIQIILEEEIDADILSTLVSYLSNNLLKQIDSIIFPNSPNDESLIDSISTPLFVMFRNQFQLCKEEDYRKKKLSAVLCELQIIQPKIGYLLLYFLKIWSNEEEKRECEKSDINRTKIIVYSDFCSQREVNLEDCLFEDLKRCHDNDISMLWFLIPDVYMAFPHFVIGHIRILHLVISTVDSSQLQDLICWIIQGHLKMLKEDDSITIITFSLDWETFEQYCLWQLISAHNFSIECTLPILPTLEYQIHAEALTSILFMLKRETPSQEILKHLLARKNTDGDMFVAAILKYWCHEHENILSELLAALLCTRFPVTSPSKRKRSSNKNHAGTSFFPTGEQILSHLDKLRQYCICSSELQLYHTIAMQKALQQVQLTSSDLLRKKYGDLFALAELCEENSSSTLRGSTRKISHTTNYNSNKGLHKRIITHSKDEVVLKKVSTKEKTIDSSDQTSDDEEIVKPKQTKKRKKINPVGSDSE
ncbi:integrator complex subunit 3 isoform X2 [Phymastichus coffea]|uniref:integrator complex subunit 3 isoform X2 n=1 Tax=Phymastichus coffea TaxID=108790 RepID=UPI00273CD7B0|nr:integrator complex subunit 3 isoform X2 [Phymastichus coffea]